MLQQYENFYPHHINGVFCLKYDIQKETEKDIYDLIESKSDEAGLVGILTKEGKMFVQDTFTGEINEIEVILGANNKMNPALIESAAYLLKQNANPKQTTYLLTLSTAIEGYKTRDVDVGIPKKSKSKFH